MGQYEELLRKLGLLHLKDNPDKLQEAILKELGMSGLKGDPDAIQKKGEEILKEKAEEFQSVKDELGRLIQKYSMKRSN